MRRVLKFLKPIATLSVVLLVFVGQGAARASTVIPTLYVNYDTHCNFTITDDLGTPVTAIPYGTYQVLVSTPIPFASAYTPGSTDLTACNGSAQFQLSGPGVSISSTLANGDAQTALFSAQLQPSSSYVAQDNNQPSVANVTFTTLGSGLSSSPTSPTAAVLAPSATTASTAKPAITSFTPTSGKPGATVTITGKNLSGASAVEINGVKAAYTVKSATKITVTVPSNAKTGKISVTTKSGTATSTKSFSVT